jgi:CRISPR-associated protein Csb1
MPGQEPATYTLESEAATKLLAAAVDAAREAGVTWREEPLRLEPSAELVDLVRKSQELAIQEAPAEAAAE